MGENSPNSSRQFWNQESVFLQTLHHLSVSWNITLLYLSSKSLYVLDKRIRAKWKFSDFLLLTWKLTNQIMSFFKQKVRFSSKFGSLFSLMRDNPSALFLAETLYAINKSNTLKWKFSDLPLLILKFTKFVTSFLEPRANFSSNFASLINSFVLFHLNLYMFSKKGTHQSGNYRTFNCSHEN